ncbi:MAG: peptidylprolyl isomerase, partial [Dehalococcoidales bacterium]|nr:peptidylprolyl isomerase [Dehalococcoidales bacterium]
MGKSSRETSAPPVMTRRQLSRYERERRLKAIIYASTAAVVVLIIGILVFGYWREFIHRGDEGIARVGNKDIATRTLAEVMGYYNSLYTVQSAQLQQIIADNQQAAASDQAKKDLVQAATTRLQQIQSYQYSLDSVALDELIQGEILRHDAASNGVTISDADRDAALVSQFGLDLDKLAKQLANPSDPAAYATTPPTPDEVAAAKETMNKVLDGGRIMSQDDFNKYVLDVQALQQKQHASVAANVPTKGEQVHALHILFQDEEQAKDTLAMIQKGDLDFAAAAQQLSQDTGTKDKGGDLGWFPRGVMDPDFEKAAFALEPGQMSDVVQTQYGYHIIKV